MLVGDVMIPNPKTLPASAVVGDVRGVFEKKNVRTVLLAEDGVFRGAIERDGLPATATDDEDLLFQSEIHGSLLLGES